MPWTDPARRQYARPAARYATGLTNAEYALVIPHLPCPSTTAGFQMLIRHKIGGAEDDERG